MIKFSAFHEKYRSRIRIKLELIARDPYQAPKILAALPNAGPPRPVLRSQGAVQHSRAARSGSSPCGAEMLFQSHNNFGKFVTKPIYPPPVRHGTQEIIYSNT
jgi:hypothetical protein